MKISTMIGAAALALVFTACSSAAATEGEPPIGADGAPSADASSSTGGQGGAGGETAWPDAGAGGKSPCQEGQVEWNTTGKACSQDAECATYLDCLPGSCNESTARCELTLRTMGEACLYDGEPGTCDPHARCCLK